MPQMSPMMWMILTTFMLISYLFLLNHMPKLPTPPLMNKKISNNKTNMKW